MAREGELPLGVMARVELSAPYRLVERHAAVEKGDEMRHAMGAHGRAGPDRDRAPCKRRDFIEGAGCDHLVEARVDAREKLSRSGARKKARHSAASKSGGLRDP